MGVLSGDIENAKKSNPAYGDLSWSWRVGGGFFGNRLGRRLRKFSLKFGVMGNMAEN